MVKIKLRPPKLCVVMSLPVSHYEALLEEVRGLRRKAQRVQQLATPLISNCSTSSIDTTSEPITSQIEDVDVTNARETNFEMDPLGAKKYCETSSSVESEDECGGARLSVSSEPISGRDRDVLYHQQHGGTWPGECSMWNSAPTPHHCASGYHPHPRMDVTSVMSFASSSGGVPLDRVFASPDLSRRSSQQLEAKVDMVYSLLAMLSGQEHADMGETLLALSANPESCVAMRQSGCIPLLVQMVQSDKEPETRKKAAQALSNLVYSQPDEKLRKREVRILKLLELIRAYTEAVREHKEDELEVIPSTTSEDGDKHPIATVGHLMKLSFDELHRQAICHLGGIYSIANLVEVEHMNHGSTINDTHCTLMRRYACMALTNLTFGDSGNKALLCSFRDFMRALVLQLQSPSDELRQVTASVLRNLSWRADSSSKEILREVGSVSGLMKAAMLDNKENTLKSILSALWNLSAHCTENKSEICSVEGALGFLVDMLTYKTPSKSLAIIENSGGILRNISSQVAVRDDYREILRQHNCLQILLDQLKSPSLTIVSNACGTLWNLSAKNQTDQDILWQLGAPAMLRSLNHSKHKMIAMGSSAALKNLLSAKPNATLASTLDSTALAMDLPSLPTLGARKQKALLQDLDQSLSETYENIEKDSPIKTSANNTNNNTNNNLFMQKMTNIVSSDDFTSLTIAASTSYDSGSTSMSLPYVEIAKVATSIPIRRKSREDDDLKNNKKLFTKVPLPKSVAKNIQSSQSQLSESDNNKDSDFACLEFDKKSLQTCSSSSGGEYEKPKLKEISCYSDEKDRCSIEDISDTDHSSLGLDHKYINNENSGDFVFRRETSENNSTPSISLQGPDQKKVLSSNVTMFEGNIDEIDMEDISIHFPVENVDKYGEKQDLEKEKKGTLSEVYEDDENVTDFIGIREEDKGADKPSSSGIPIPRSLPRPIPTPSSAHKPQNSDNNLSTTELAISTNDSETSVKRQNRLSALPRRSLPSSTPIRINQSDATSLNDTSGNNNAVVVTETSERNTIKHNKGSSEAAKVDKIDKSDIPLSTERSVPSLNCFTDASVSGIEQVHLNISQEHNTSQSDSPPVVEEKAEAMQSLLQNQECPYLDPESCVNFAIKDDRDRLLERSCEDSNLDNRMLDPDAMIESLDRFTAELVSQASHLQSKEDDKYKDNTWNEDTSPNEVTFPSISSTAPNVITFSSNDSGENDNIDGVEAKLTEPLVDTNDNKEVEAKSNDFSSMNTSTMTESTLIAIEATKMASVFKNEAEMSKSSTSLASLELDKIQPPSFLESLSCDTKSPKLSRKIPRGLMLKRALSNSLNTNSSLESLENNSLSNLDLVNPPSILGEVFDMDASITSIASLPNENSPNFLINGPVNKSKMTSNLTQLNSVSDLENINPPSLFGEITDLCNSLADVPTEAIGSETEIFEDCHTHVPPTEDDVTEFSDANSATPIQSDISSPETSPKKSISKTLSGKSLTSKQKRNLARYRYKTYTVAAEMVMKQESNENNSTSDDFKTVECFSEEYKSVLDSQTSYVSPTYSVKTTPKERRRLDKERFETRVVTKEEIVAIENSAQSPNQSPTRSKLSIRRNFMQKRLENRDRFKTQTLQEPTLPNSPLPDLSSTSPIITASPSHDFHLLVHQEANLVLKSLRETKTKCDDLLDCETLSLVSNDDDSEQNSCSSLNYRTYHKSWGLKKNVPVIEPTMIHNAPEINRENQRQVEDNKADEEECVKETKLAKPKIVKPNEVTKESLGDEEEQNPTDESQVKAIRGRRKALYSKSTIANKVAPKTIKPIKTMTSNLVKNVSATFRSNPKPPAPVSTPKNPVAKPPRASNSSAKNSPKSSPVKKSPIERQGTFTKDEAAAKSRIPTAGSRIPTSRIPAKVQPTGASRPKSVSSDKPNPRLNYARSTSADSREIGTRKIQNSSSSQSLKSAGAVKKSIPVPAQRSGSNSSLNSNGTSSKKQVTSKIASLWKKIEESKNKQPVKKDTRVWIQGKQASDDAEPALIRSNTFDNKDGVALRNKMHENDSGKRVSRLGSFIVMDEGEDGTRVPQIITAAE